MISWTTASIGSDEKQIKRRRIGRGGGIAKKKILTMALAGPIRSSCALTFDGKTSKRRAHVTRRSTEPEGGLVDKALLISVRGLREYGCAASAELSRSRPRRRSVTACFTMCCGLFTLDYRSLPDSVLVPSSPRDLRTSPNPCTQREGLGERRSRERRGVLG